MLPLLTLILIGNERGFLGTARASADSACHCLSKSLSSETTSSCTSAFMTDGNTCETMVSPECKDLKVLEHGKDTESKVEPLAIVSVTYDATSLKDVIGFDSLEFIFTIPKSGRNLLLWFRHPRTGKLYHLKDKELSFQPKILISDASDVIVASDDTVKSYGLSVNTQIDFRTENFDKASTIETFSTYEVTIDGVTNSNLPIHVFSSLHGMAILKETSKRVYLLDNEIVHEDNFVLAEYTSYADDFGVQIGIQSFTDGRWDHILAYGAQKDKNNIVIWKGNGNTEFLVKSLEDDFSVNRDSEGHQISSVVVSEHGEYIYIGLRKETTTQYISSDILILRYRSEYFGYPGALTLIGSVRNPMTEMSISGEDIGLEGLTLSPDGKKLFVASYTKDDNGNRFGSIVQWDVDTQTGALYNGHLVQCGPSMLKKPIDVTISSDGKFLSGIDEKNDNIFSLHVSSRLMDWSDQELLTELSTRQGSCT